MKLSWLRAEEPMSEIGHPLITLAAALALTLAVREFGVQWMKRLE